MEDHQLRFPHHLIYNYISKYYEILDYIF